MSNGGISLVIIVTTTTTTTTTVHFNLTSASVALSALSHILYVVQITSKRKLNFLCKYIHIINLTLKKLQVDISDETVVEVVEYITTHICNAPVQ